MIRHKHHIIPKHAGGTDDPSNIIELSMEEHAEAHRALYEKYQREEDKIAWLALSGQVSNKKAVQMGKTLGRKKANNTLEQKYGIEWRSFISLRGKKRIREILENDPNFLKERNVRIFTGRTHTEETKRKMSLSLKEKGIGKNNSQYGTLWITDGTDNKKIKKDESLPEGWCKGRTINNRLRTKFK